MCEQEKRRRIVGIVKDGSVALRLSGRGTFICTSQEDEALYIQKSMS